MCLLYRCLQLDSQWSQNTTDNVHKTRHNFILQHWRNHGVCHWYLLVRTTRKLYLCNLPWCSQGCILFELWTHILSGLYYRMSREQQPFMLKLPCAYCVVFSKLCGERYHWYNGSEMSKWCWMQLERSGKISSCSWEHMYVQNCTM